MRKFSIIQQLFSRAKIPTIEEVKKEWNDYSHQYNQFDLGPQTFYYSLVTLLKFHEAKNILEIACGTGKLIPFALQKKNKEACYIASDIAPNMVELSKNNLLKHFQRYQSKISFQEWCRNQKILFEVLNAQENIQNHQPFDRIICNCALMITADAQKMLLNLAKNSKKNCLFGLSVWGNKQNNNFMSAIRQSIIQSGFELPRERSNFHLYQKVSTLAEKTGWQVVLNWQQNALFPVLQNKPQENQELFLYQINKLPLQQRQAVRQKLYSKIQRIFKDKKGLNFCCQLFILRKK